MSIHCIDLKCIENSGWKTEANGHNHRVFLVLLRNCQLVSENTVVISSSRLGKLWVHFCC